MPKTQQQQQTQHHQLFSEGPAVSSPFGCWIVGDTPLITHAWSLKARLEMLTKQIKTAKAGREARDPDQDFRDSLYVFGFEQEDADAEAGVPDRQIATDGKGQPIYGFPATGIKNSILAVAHKDKGVAKTDVMSALFIHGRMARGVPAKAGAICDLPLVRIWAPPPAMREDMVRVGVGLSKTASLAYRGQFWPWGMRVVGSLNTSAVSAESLAFLIREAGTACGLGEWRNERRGMFGAYHLANKAESEAWEAYAGGGPLPLIDEDAPLTLAAA